MPQTPVLTFAEAMAQAKQKQQKVHVLLGNGFSIACRPDIFAYNALFDRAEFPEGDAVARAAFEILATRDFEEVMRALRDGAKLIAALSPENRPLAAQFRNAATALREILVRTISNQHPEAPADIPQAAYRSCRSFLGNFDSIYSLNYDLLLYWAIMQKELGPGADFDDGFRTPENGPTAYVTWEVEKSDQQSVHYLHGALHIFDAGAELKKFTWINTGMRLIEQVRQALESDMYPLIVAEGESHQKKAKITHSNYLSRSFRSLPKVTGALFIFGHSLAPNDEHILRLIERGKTRQLYVSLFGDPRSASNRAVVARAEEMAAYGKGRDLIFYDAESANVWG